MQQEVVLAMLAKEPSQGYHCTARLDDALGPLGEALNAGQIYVVLGRLENAGLVSLRWERGGGTRSSERKVYAADRLSARSVSTIGSPRSAGRSPTSPSST